jgi:hypothetical protein
LRQNSPEAKESSFGTLDALILNEWSRIFPVAESNTVMVRATSQIDDYAENNKTSDCDDLDGSVVISEYEIGI